MNPRTRWEELADFDYLNKLNDEEKAFLNKFMDEWVNASFDKNKKKNLIKDKKTKKDIHHRNYARREDAYTLSKINGKVVDLEDIQETYDDENELNFQIEIKHRNSEFVKNLKKKL